MSTAQYIADASIRHQVFLQRYAGGESKRAIAALSRIRRDIVARLANEPTEFRASRLNAVLDDINAITATGFKDIALDIKASSYKLASIEADFSAALYTRASDADFVLPPDSALIQSVEASGMAAALATGQKNPTIDAALTDFSKQKAKQINQIIADGVTLGDTTPEISRRLAATINTLQKRQLDALVRTITNHTSSAARIAVYDQNADIIEGYEWVATLDNRTTLICGSRDGNIYQVGKGPLPPAHWNACAEDTMITTLRGKVPIQDVVVGDYALTHAGRWRRVNAVMAKKESAKVVELVDSLGSSVRLTMDHPILSSKGYNAAGDIKVGDNLFKYANKLVWLKGWVGRPFVKQRVLIDAHNMKTNIVERLVAYSVTSLAAGVSASIYLNNDVANHKISNIVSNYRLRFKFYTSGFKKVVKKLLMKCKIIAEGRSQ